MRLTEMSWSSWSNTILSEADLDLSGTCSKPEKCFKKKWCDWCRKQLQMKRFNHVFEFTGYRNWNLRFSHLTWCIDFIHKEVGMCQNQLPHSPSFLSGLSGRDFCDLSALSSLEFRVCQDFLFQPHSSITSHPPC